MLVILSPLLTELAEREREREGETNMQLPDAGQCHSPYSKLLKNCP
jgi:hypothetical protein